MFGKINDVRLDRLENFIILIIKYYIYTKFTPLKKVSFETLRMNVISRL